MNSKEIEGAKQLIEIPDVKAGSYSFIGDSDVTYADVRILLDYIKDLEQENQKYKEVFDKISKIIYEIKELIETTGGYPSNYIDNLLDILKEVE